MTPKRKARGLGLQGDQGFAMLWALVVILVVLISSALLAKLTFDSFQRTQIRALERRAWWLSQTGINRYLTSLNSSDIEIESLLESEIADSISGNESIKRTLYPWAGTLLAVSTGKVGTRSHTSATIIGQKSDLPDSVLIRTRDPRYPLVIAGSSRIEGKVVSAAGRPMAGLFEGRGPTQSYVDSLIVERADTFPEIDPWLWKLELSTLRELSSELLFTQYGTRHFVEMRLEGVFQGPRLLVAGDLELVSCTLKVDQMPIQVYVQGALTIRGQSKLEGLIKFWARDAIKVGGTAVIDGAALISDSSLVLTDSSYCRTQFLTGYTATISENASLAEGSSLVALVDISAGRSIPMHSLRVQTTGDVNCHFVAYTYQKDVSEDIPRLQIDSNVAFTGNVTCNHFVELYSDVSGQFDVNSFWLRSAPTTYINWIIDSHIKPKMQGHSSVYLPKTVAFYRMLNLLN